LSGLANLFAAFFIILARVDQVLLFANQPLSVYSQNAWFVPLVGVPGIVGSVFFLLGVTGIYVGQAQRAGWIGLIAFLLAFTGLSFSLSANWAYAYVSPYIGSLNPLLLDANFRDAAWGLLGQGFLQAYFLGAAGYMLFALSTLSIRGLPRWAGIVMLISMPLAALLPIDVNSKWAIALNVVLASGPLASGIALWMEGE
jgi:hypothetical protein